MIAAGQPAQIVGLFQNARPILAIPGTPSR
jgi:hypothetical protein